jgi:hypothetical protein
MADNSNRETRSWAMNQQFQEKFKEGNVKEYVKPVTFKRDTDNYDGRRLTTVKKPKVIATPMS